MKLLLSSTLFAAIIFLVIDIIWLSFAVKSFYRPNIGDLLLEKPIMWAAALFYITWAAFATIVSGLILAWLYGYVHDAVILGIGSGGGKNTAIGIGMWLGLIMAYNVWFVIWPNQKRALGIVESDPETKAKSAKTAMLFSRTNTLLSLPMLLSMVAAQNLY